MELFVLKQQDYINNDSVQRSFYYYLNLDDNAKKLIDDYKSEMDYDDWEDHPLDITYTVINWILQHKSRNLDYRPELIEHGVLTEEQFMNQMYNAERLNYLLQSFPLATNPVILYRGESNDFGKYFIENKRRNQITLYSFLSTSTNLSVATNFSRGTLLCFILPSGNPLSFISNKLTMNYNTSFTYNQDSSESEVLLPLGCTFQLLGMNNDVVINGKQLNVYYLQVLSVGPHQTRNFWSNYIKMAKNLYDKYKVEIEEEMEIGGSFVKKKRKSRKGKVKRRKTKKGRI